jgi:hypothetical protein
VEKPPPAAFIQASLEFNAPYRSTSRKIGPLPATEVMAPVLNGLRTTNRSE